MMTEEGCLKCHGAQGYKVGDVRGGIGIALPLGPFMDQQKGRTRVLLMSHVLVWMLGMAGIAVGARRVGDDMREMEAAYGKLDMLERAINTARVGITIRDTRNRIWYTNPAEARMHGYEVEELIGKEVGIFSPTGTVKALSAEEMRAIEGYSRESLNARKDGSVFPVYIVSEIVRDAKGDPIGIVAVSEDITGRKALEDKLKEYTEHLEDMVGERTRELESARREAEDANRAKSEFLTSMSHELRTPLHSVIGFAELMSEGLAGAMTEKQKEYLADILDGGRHLLSLINDILDISKVECGKTDFDLSDVDLKPVIERTLAMFREKALRHDIKLQSEVPDCLGTVAAEERRVKQVLFNLIGNAVKFTPDGGRVGVRARRTEKEAVVEVWDTGIGISEKDMARIFNPFERADSAWAKEREGTGLGLHVTRKFVELHGGRIWASSSPGKGSRFTFTLPLKPVCGLCDLP
jgi:PAS domain S-box-containing protein